MNQFTDDTAFFQGGGGGGGGGGTSLLWAALKALEYFGSLLSQKVAEIEMFSRHI